MFNRYSKCVTTPNTLSRCQKKKSMEKQQQNSLKTEENDCEFAP